MLGLFIKDKDFYKNVAKIAIPIALQGLITTGVNMLDTVMVGKVGETQLSAVSLANQFINIFHIFCMGIGMGASVLVSRYYGMKDRVGLKKTVSIMLRLCLLMSLIFAVATAVCPTLIMKIYTVEAPIISYGVEYLNYSIITYFLLGLSLTCTIVLRNVGQVRIPLYTSIGAFFVNAGANYVLIFGKLGAPKMGVAGAALGTLIARIFEFAIICGYLFFKDKEIGFRIKHVFEPVGSLWREYMRMSIPVLISDGILALGNNSVAMVIGRLGESFVAANAITTVTQQLSSVMIQGFSQAGAIVTGRTLGEGQREKAYRQGYAFLGLGILFGAVAAGIIMLISEPVITAYDLSPETQALARELMLSISIIVLFQASNSIMTKGVLRGGGDTKILMAADNIFLWIASIPLGILAGFVFDLSAFWIYFFLKVDQVLKAIWCVIRLKSGKWIKKIRSTEEMQ
ncbi:MAG: MATE family efflux transporter [Clostridia bacterium]|nr:MATE family efflux transporter [Clostridia bacterium]